MHECLHAASYVFVVPLKGALLSDRYVSQVQGGRAQVAATRPHVFAAVALVK